MQERIRVMKDVGHAQRKLLYIAYVDNRTLKQRCGFKDRRFSSEDAARQAAEKHIQSSA